MDATADRSGRARAHEHRGLHAPDALHDQLVARCPDIVLVVDDAGTIRYLNPASEAQTGWRIDDTLGRNILELIHPDDLERTIFDLDLYSRVGSVAGYSSYRVRLADGSFRHFDVVAADVVMGGEPMLALYARPDETASASVLQGLLRGTSTAERLRPVCDVINWDVHGSRVGICWEEGGSLHSVGTDLPGSLAGADGVVGTPWAQCWRGATTQRSTDLSVLDPARRALAEELELGSFWIEPVLDEEAAVCAAVTIWMRAGGKAPELHTLGMSMAKDYVQLIVSWSRQRKALHDAAHRDALTGLANRTAFFQALDAQTGGGALLYCDLDGFKPVNDGLGHVAGDELLRAVAGRIKACVRAGDVVARLGGDEFAVLCGGVTAPQTRELAQRILAAVRQPFRLSGATAHVGISIGVAHEPDRLGEATLEAADRALLGAKSVGGSTVGDADGA